MKFLFIHSDKVMLNDIPWGLLELGEEVEIYDETITLQKYVDKEYEDLCRYLKHNSYDVLITHNFSPMISDACQQSGRLYFAWVFDSPQWELFQKAVGNPCNRLFIFDKNFALRLKKRDVKNVYYLPLAANVTRAEGLQVSDSDIARFSHEISFVGSLYSENFYDTYIQYLSGDVREEILETVNQYVGHWEKGVTLTGALSRECCDKMGERIHIDLEDKADAAYFSEVGFLCHKAARQDRIHILNLLAKTYDVTLYTGDQTQGLENVHIHGRVSQDYEVPRIYHLSKLNLNITLRSIETGVPKRVLDIMAAGGTVLSNYQEEMEELFEPGKEIITFQNDEELMDKASFYRTHERERLQLGWNGYQRVKADYTYPVLLKKMIKLAGD